MALITVTFRRKDIPPGRWSKEMLRVWLTKVLGIVMSVMHQSDELSIDINKTHNILRTHSLTTKITLSHWWKITFTCYLIKQNNQQQYMAATIYKTSTPSLCPYPVYICFMQIWVYNNLVLMGSINKRFNIYIYKMTKMIDIHQNNITTTTKTNTNIAK